MNAGRKQGYAGARAEGKLTPDIKNIMSKEEETRPGPTDGRNRSEDLLRDPAVMPEMSSRGATEGMKVKRVTLDLNEEDAELLNRIVARKSLSQAQVLRQALRRSSWLDTVLTDPDRKLVMEYKGGDRDRILDLG